MTPSYRDSENDEERLIRKGGWLKIGIDKSTKDARKKPLHIHVQKLESADRNFTLSSRRSTIEAEPEITASRN